MTRDTVTVDLRKEADRLDSELDDVAMEMAQINAKHGDDDKLPDGVAGDVEELFERKDSVEQRLAGVLWALDEYAPDPEPSDDEDEDEVEDEDESDEPPTLEMTIGGLTTGEYAKVQDRTETARNEKIGWGQNVSVEGAGSIFFAAAGIVEAEWLGVPQGTGFEKRVQVLNGTVPQFKAFVEDKVDGKTTPEVELGNFAERLQAKREELETES